MSCAAMRCPLPMTVIAASMLAMCIATQAEQQPQTQPLQTTDAVTTLRVNVRLVPVFVNATDSHGVPIPGLTKEDFRVTEDGIPQQIKLFERQSEQPLNIVLAVDTSGSVRKDKPQLATAATQFLRGLVRPVDRVELLEFSNSVRQAVPFTSNVKAIESGLKNMQTGYATALYQAIELASQRLRPLTGRKIIVLVTDGGNTAKGASYDEAYRAAIAAETSIYSLIDVPVEASAGRDLGGEHALITLAEDTGGKFYYDKDGESLQASFHRLSDDLRTQYLLGYYPSQRESPEDFRRIGISLLHPQAGQRVTLRYRPGYFVTKPAAE